MRAVLDTNVIVSGILSATGASRALLVLGREGRLDLVASPVLLAELEEVLARFFSLSAAAEIRATIEETAYVTEPGDVPAVSRDPDDDHVLAAAAAGGAQYIVTRDRDLLELGSYGDIRILEPGPALQLIRSALS